MAKPFKYKIFVESLDPNEIYSPASIVRHGEKAGFLEGLSEKELKLTRRRIRHTFARLSTNRRFPYLGDGWFKLPGQAPLRGWYGWRWQDAIKKDATKERRTKAPNTSA